MIEKITMMDMILRGDSCLSPEGILQRSPWDLWEKSCSSFNPVNPVQTIFIKQIFQKNSQTICKQFK